MRMDNIAMLKNTLHILNQGYYTVDGKRVPLKLTREQMESAQAFRPEEVRAIRKSTDFKPTPSPEKCVYGCKNIDSFTLARHLIEELRASQSADENPIGSGTSLVAAPNASSDMDPVTASDTGSSAAPNANSVLVLNLANPVHPGGGVRKGSKAQEEDLCRKSSLLLSLESRNAYPYYRYNRKLDTYMGSDGIVISPQVEIIKDDHGELLSDSVIVSVMTCAAPMLKYGREGMSQDEYETMMFQRITGMLTIAAYFGYKNLVLGAFGCGAFRNDAHVVSDIFRRAFRAFDFGGLAENMAFSRVEFAVMDHSIDQYNFNEFSRNFSDFYREKSEK